MEPQYNIVFKGKVSPGKDPEQAQKILAVLFKQNAPKVLAPFTGGAPYIRKNLTLDQAKKFKAAFDKAGAAIQVVKTFKCPDCGHIQKANSQCEKCMNLKIEFESDPKPDQAVAPTGKPALGKQAASQKTPTFSTKKLNHFAIYKVVFKGEIQQGFDEDMVKNNLAQEFKAEIFKVTAPFAGGDDYLRGQINGIEAEKLRERFERAGAVVNVIETVPCPGCGKILEVGENCPECFEEQKSPDIDDAYSWNGVPELPTVEKKEATFGDAVGSNEEFRQEAFVRFKRGSILFILVFAYLYYSAKGMAFDFDLFYLISAPYFCRGCYFMARAKGYSKWFWLLGLAGLVGPAVLLLLPDRTGNTPEKSVTKRPYYKKEWVWGLVCLAVVAVFPLEDVVTHFRFERAMKRTEEIVKNAATMSYNIPTTKQADVLMDLLDDYFSIHSYCGANSRDAIAIREGFTLLMEHFFIGLQGKQHRQSMTPEGVLDGYSVEEINFLKKKVIEAFEERVLKEPTTYVEQSYMAWYEATHNDRIPDTFPKKFMDELGLNIGAIMHNLQIYMEENYLCLPIHEDQIFNPQNYATDPSECKPKSKEALEKIATINVDKYSAVHLKIKETRFTPKGLAGATVVFVPKIHKEFKDNREIHRYRYYRVGGSLPDFFLGKKDVLAMATAKHVKSYRAYQKHHPLLTR